MARGEGKSKGKGRGRGKGAPEVKYRGKPVSARVVVEGAMAMVRDTLLTWFNEEKVDRALAQAKRRPAVKAMLALAKAPRKGGAGGGGGGPKAVRSAYQAYATLAMNALRAANRQDLANMTLVGQTWNKLPRDVKAGVEERLNALKERYNASLEAADGEEAAPSLSEALRDLDREEGNEAVDFIGLISRYKDQPTQPKAEAPQPAGAAKRGPGRPRKTEAAGAAPVPAEEGRRDAAPAAAGGKRGAGEEAGGGEGSRKKGKKQKKDKHRDDDE